MKIIMGMKFEDWEEVPDFGSIALVSSESMAVKHYCLLDSDISKLDLITNASDGSDAFTDRGRLFIKLSDVWTEVTDDEQS